MPSHWQRATRDLSCGAAKFTTQPCEKCGGSMRVVNGAWLRERREAAGVALREMARRLDFSAPYISDVERGRRNCTAEILSAYERLAS